MTDCVVGMQAFCYVISDDVCCLCWLPVGCVVQATQVKGTVMPIAKGAAPVEFVPLTDVSSPPWSMAVYHVPFLLLLYEGRVSDALYFLNMFLYHHRT